MNTALAIIEPKSHPFYTPAEMRARSILSRMESISAKLKTLEDDIRLLWIDFDNLKTGETILGCSTKKEFCEAKLSRTPRAIQYMLAGGNPDNGKRSEIISPPDSNIEETHWISKENRCPTGKRGFDFPDDIWQAMRAKGAIGETDFVAYIGRCGQCGRCHRDKDQSGHKEGDVHTRHQTWYRPDELNAAPTGLPILRSLEVEPQVHPVTGCSTQTFPLQPSERSDTLPKVPEELIESEKFVEALQALVDKFPNAIDIIRFDYHRKPNVTIKNGKIDIQYYWCVR